MQQRAIHLNGNVSREHQVNSSRLTWTWVWLLTLNIGQGPDNGFRTLMVISSTLACFHSFPPLPLLPSNRPFHPPCNDNWGGVKWSNSTEIFSKEKIRDRCNAINTLPALLRKSNSEARYMNGDVVSFEMCARAIYRVGEETRRTALCLLQKGA